jgi:3-isopropylmalate/(R)-2-methylmalate dehydratase small subunit
VSRPPFTTVVGPAAPLMLSNIDTDVIIRVERMTSTDPQALAPYAFEALRYIDGSEDPEFVLNQPRYRGAPILIAGDNFGCGSSREPAVWSLMGLGIRCVIAPSFGDIFVGNCLTNGVLPIVLDPASIAQLVERSTAGNAVVDLGAQRVSAGEAWWPFEIGALSKMTLLEGLDDLELSMRFRPDTASWERRDRRDRPWAWNATEEAAP